jgi:hypothetical protein
VCDRCAPVERSQVGIASTRFEAISPKVSFTDAIPPTIYFFEAIPPSVPFIEAHSQKQLVHGSVLTRFTGGLFPGLCRVLKVPLGRSSPGSMRPLLG